jgi:hypothetical protein
MNNSSTTSHATPSEIDIGAATKFGNETSPIEYEWHETFPSHFGKDLVVPISDQDGMASLPVNSQNSGYLGE